METTILQIVETTEITKDIGTLKDLTMIEVYAITKTIITEAEITVTIGIITIIDTIIADQIQDTQIAVIQDITHHTTEIIFIIAKNTTNKDNTAKTQTEVIDTDNDQRVTIDIILTIITEIID